MCTVYEFPIKPELTDELKNMLEKNARDYINGVNETLAYIDSIYGESDKYDEIMVLVYDYIGNAIMQAIEEI